MSFFSLALSFQISRIVGSADFSESCGGNSCPSLTENPQLNLRFQRASEFKSFFDKIVDWSLNIYYYFGIF